MIHLDVDERRFIAWLTPREGEHGLSKTEGMRRVRAACLEELTTATRPLTFTELKARVDARCLRLGWTLTETALRNIIRGWLRGGAALAVTLTGFASTSQLAIADKLAVAGNLRHEHMPSVIETWTYLDAPTVNTEVKLDLDNIVLEDYINPEVDEPRLRAEAKQAVAAAQLLANALTVRPDDHTRRAWTAWADGVDELLQEVVHKCTRLKALARN